MQVLVEGLLQWSSPIRTELVRGRIFRGTFTPTCHRAHVTGKCSSRARPSRHGMRWSPAAESRLLWCSAPLGPFQNRRVVRCCLQLYCRQTLITGLFFMISQARS